MHDSPQCLTTSFYELISEQLAYVRQGNHFVLFVGGGMPMGFENQELTAHERAMDLLQQLTLPEKISQMLHRSPSIERLGIPAYNWWNEGLHGVARAGKATVFPQMIGLAATFDPLLLKDIGVAVAREAREKYERHKQTFQSSEQYFGLTFWCPNINIFRDPRWGRGQETFGEDPFLTSQMGAAFVNGLQQQENGYRLVDATIKHFAVHSGPESLRHELDVCIGDKQLHQTYLRAFKYIVENTDVKGVMSAYNRVNHQGASASRWLLTDILRNQWGFKGYVVSDCWALMDLHMHHGVTKTIDESAALALKAGVNLNCGSAFEWLGQAVEKELVDESEINMALLPLLETRFELGMFDDVSKPKDEFKSNIVRSEKHKNLARLAAQRSLVLLKNNDAVLPLSSQLSHIMVLGPCAEDLSVLRGNYFGLSPRLVSLIEGITDAVEDYTRVTYWPATDILGNKITDPSYYLADAETCDAIILTVGLSPALEGEELESGLADHVGDKESLSLPEGQKNLIRKLHSTGKPIILVVTGGSPVDLSWEKEYVSAILFCWYPGEQGGHAVADVLFGDYNPSGRLPISFVESISELPAFDDYSMQGRTYRFMEQSPVFRFGDGLSFTDFIYSEPSIETRWLKSENLLVLNVSVKNAGNRDGDEVIQVYGHAQPHDDDDPVRSLIAFRRVNVIESEQQSVSFEIPLEQLAYYSDTGETFFRPGWYHCYVGGRQPVEPVPSFDDAAPSGGQWVSFYLEQD